MRFACAPVCRIGLALIAMIPSGCAGLERAQHRAQPGQLYATGFEDGDWVEAWNRDERPRNTRRRDAPDDVDPEFAPWDDKALRVTIPGGEHTGASVAYRFAAPGPVEMAASFMLRFAPNWQTLSTGKLPGFAGTYDRGGWGGRRSDGRNGWSARMMFGRPTDDGRVPLGSYVYHMEQKRDTGDAWMWRDAAGDVVAVQRNRWYRIRQYVRMNTPGARDGVLRAWVDGELVFEKTDIRFRAVDDLRIDRFWLDVYHGGKDAAGADYSVYFDDVVIGD